MKQAKKAIPTLRTGPQLNENLVCEACGRFGAYRLGDRTICQDCYTGSGSCCPEFGKDDLWEFPDEASRVSAQPGSQRHPKK